MRKPLDTLSFGCVGTVIRQLGFVANRHPQNLRKWTASWIACTDAPVRDAGVFHFRRLLTLKNVPEHFVVHVSADNQFLLHVNQQRVGSGPARGIWRIGDLRLTISLPSFAPEQMC